MRRMLDTRNAPRTNDMNSCIVHNLIINWRQLKLIVALLCFAGAIQQSTAFMTPVSVTSTPRSKSPRSKAGSQIYSSSASNRQSTAGNLVREGMEAFRRGDVAKSIELFDEAETVGGPGYTPYLWQRGISYYYVDRFAEASSQFQTDTKVNPRDTEEIVWDIASRLRADQNQAFPLVTQMALPKGTSDPRRIMSAVYRLFRGEGTEYELASAGQSGSASDEFYSLFYLGLFCDATGKDNSSKAPYYLSQASSTDYATRMGKSDYMTAVAQVHRKIRGWL